MTPESPLDQLQALAEAATPGPWRSAEGDLGGGSVLSYLAVLLGNREKDGTTSGRLFLTLAPNDIDPERGAEVVPATTGDGPRSEANAAFIAAANPQTVLSLIAALTEARAEVERLSDALRRKEREAKNLRALHSEAVDIGMRAISKREAAEARVAELEAEVEQHKAVADSMQHFADVAEVCERKSNKYAAELATTRETLRRVEGLADKYEADARHEGYGGELWSTTGAAIRAALAQSAQEGQG